MRTRHTPRLDARRLFDRVNYSSLDWPLKTIRLEPDTVEECNQRIASPRVSVAELYHENSKLFEGVLDRLAATHVDPDEVRREFLERRRSSVAATAPYSFGDPRVIGLLTAVRDACPIELFYAIDLRVCEAGRLCWHEPMSDACFLIKELTEERHLRFRSAVVPRRPRDARDGVAVVLVGNLARNDLLYGARGYRRTLLEAGRIAETVVRQASLHGAASGVWFEFVDRQVDACLECDGVEEAALAIIEVEWV
jgi:hypothetical protein